MRCYDFHWLHWFQHGRTVLALTLMPYYTHVWSTARYNGFAFGPRKPSHGFERVAPPSRQVILYKLHLTVCIGYWSRKWSSPLGVPASIALLEGHGCCESPLQGHASSPCGDPVSLAPSASQNGGSSLLHLFQIRKVDNHFFEYPNKQFFTNIEHSIETRHPPSAQAYFQVQHPLIPVLNCTLHHQRVNSVNHLPSHVLLINRANMPGGNPDRSHHAHAHPRPCPPPRPRTPEPVHRRWSCGWCKRSGPLSIMLDKYCTNTECLRRRDGYAKTMP